MLSRQRTEWQQRIHAVLHHHGVPQQRNVRTLERREWLADQPESSTEVSQGVRGP